MNAAQWGTLAQIASVVFAIITGLLAYIANRVSAGRVQGANEQRMNALEKSLEETQADVKEIPKIATQVAVLATEMKGFRDLVDRDIQEVKHNSRNIRVGLDNLTKQLTEFAARPH